MLRYQIGYKDLQWYDASRERVVLASAWYPTYMPMHEVTYLAHFKSHAHQDAAIAPGNFPLILISHGSRGHRYNQYYLAEFLAQSGYIVFSIEHSKDTAFEDEFSDLPINHLHRLLDVEFALHQISKENFSKTSINWHHVAHIGHSFGGFTSFLLGGGQSSLIPQEIYHKIQKGICQKIRCFIMLAPAFFDTIAENRKMSKPTLLITATNDELLGETNLRYLMLLPHVNHIALENVGHYVFLMECPEAVANQCPEIALDIGTPRSNIHPLINQEIQYFLNQHLHS